MSFLTFLNSDFWLINLSKIIQKNAFISEFISYPFLFFSEEHKMALGFEINKTQINKWHNPTKTFQIEQSFQVNN